MTINKPKFYQVGGSVRDKFMGRQSNDIDWVVVGATPEWMLAQGYSQVGAEFPVYLDDKGTEYALARTERKVGAGYHGFETKHDTTVTLTDDLLRRDLTINAIAYDPETKEYIDPFGGILHIESQVLCHVSEAFREDPVRVLRLARFNAQFGEDWIISTDTEDLCQQMVNAGELNHLTKERVWKEFEKALNTPNVLIFLENLHVFGALKVVFPLFDKKIHVISKILEEMDSENQTPQTRFTLIMTMFNPTVVQDFCEEYRIPNEYKDYALFHSRLARKVNLNHYRSPRIVIDLLNEHGIYRGNHYMLKGPWKAPYISILQSAYERTKHVNFEMLTDKQKNTLKGKDIGRAIDWLRAKILTS